MRPSVVRPCALLVAILGAALLPAAASAARLHLALRRAEPAANAQVAGPVRELRLWFTQRAELRVTTVKVTDAKGAEVATGALARGDAADAPIVAPLKAPLAPGAYTVRWRTMARDGHVVSGGYAFTVTAAAAAR